MEQVVQNTARELVTLNLPHEYVCTEERCLCVRVTQVHTHHDRKTGAITGRPKRVRVGHSVTLTAKGTEGSEGRLPHGALNVPEIAALVRAGLLRVVNAPAPAATPHPAPSVEATPTEPPALPALGADDADDDEGADAPEVGHD
ncbi:MAG: hypothetical protein HOW73_43150 [Polyangiaceae bacterium]|nr:hypothetical protein [Polyangiaceae bacterium]